MKPPETDMPRSAIDARMCLRLLARLMVQDKAVVARNYANGGWHQYSGRDFVAHLGRAAEGWTDWLAEREDSPRSGKKSGASAQPRRCLMSLASQSYGSMVTTTAALLVGMDVVFAPEQATDAGLVDIAKHFGADALLCDPHRPLPAGWDKSLPVFHTVQKTWAAEDPSPPPQILRDYAALEEGRRKGTGHGVEAVPGDLLFVSIGNDGFQQKVRLTLNSLMVAAQNFVLQVGVPASVQWNSIELISLAHPFSHTARFAVLLKKGVLGYGNPDAEWENNLSILRPSCVFVGPTELELVAAHITETRRRNRFRSRAALSEGLRRARDYLQSGRSLKLSPVAFGVASRVLRSASRSLVGPAFLEEAAGQLKFVVHGLSAASRTTVRALERLGVPVVETYGKTAGAGLLSSNTFNQPHFGLVGSPLAHVSFRLGGDSVLEYRISSEHFPNSGEWVSTGDVAQMTPHGFSIVGRKQHQLITRGGVLISPARFERRITEAALIEQACLVGDGRPYLAALLVLSPEARAANTRDPESVRVEIEAIMSTINETLPRNGTIKKIEILDSPFLESRGEVLPNGQINRLKIAESYADIIAKIYAGSEKKKERLTAQDNI